MPLETGAVAYLRTAIYHAPLDKPRVGTVDLYHSHRVVPGGSETTIPEDEKKKTLHHQSLYNVHNNVLV